MINEDQPRLLSLRSSTPAEITRDIVIALINRSNLYDPKQINEHRSRHQRDAIIATYEAVFKKVQELGTGQKTGTLI